MDPNMRGPEEYGHDGDGSAPRQRPPRDPLTPDFGQHSPALARTVQLVTGDYLLTVNPVDGSEIEACPPGERPGRPEKFTAAERAEVDRAAKPPVPPGPGRPSLHLLERQEERERLVRLLARGRSVRLTGPAGSGRTALLDLVAEDCADLAPDGVVRLSGFHRTANELLYDLFYAVYHAPLHRPEQDELLGLVREIGAVVVLDDVEFGGAGLDELLDATPECAFVIGATPEVPAPSADSTLEEVFLGGLDRAGGVELIERAVGRTLTEEEANWAGDLWFESEGLPLRFVQAGALLRQRDQQRAGTGAVDTFGVFEDAIPADAPFDVSLHAEDGDEVPLPSLGEAAAPAPLLASRLSASARATLRFAVALAGEVPHQAHLPALVGDTHADAALGELASCGLVSPVGSRYRLAAGVLAQLEAAGYGDDIEAQALAAAQHYAWWAGHPSVTPERVCAEADALLAALGILVPGTTAPAEGEESVTVRLARTAAPAFAAGLHWSAWERALRSGAEASRLAGEVSEQAYFHHELGILALCGGQLDRARAELESSIGLRGALADKRGTVAGRRALALVSDRSGTTPGLGSMAGEEVPDARYEESQSPPGGVPAAFAVNPPPSSGDTSTIVVNRAVSGPPPRTHRGGIRGLARRNLVAAGAGALLAAVLGTVVTLGATSNNDANNPSDKVGVNPSASQGTDDGSLGADKPKSDTGTATSRPTNPGASGTPGTSGAPTPSSSTGQPSDNPSGTKGSGGASTPTKSTSPTPTKSTSPTPTKSASPTPTKSASPTPSDTSSTTPTQPTSPSTSNSASAPITSTAPVTSAPASTTRPASTSSSPVM
ncbi:ATP-binding protein [Streptomyces guryensis]|uniref:ATP-binding protein n=1 Tax=Streptomyces guryensis TaxID=2886947 RepID=A0A9Q3Z849_9ACTN|nr:ATP-binding protein [Streptomyces guryensis]MCD9878113.1 ATP-binding protein [Streptomyces guryensis]